MNPAEKTLPLSPGIKAWSRISLVLTLVLTCFPLGFLVFAAGFPEGRVALEAIVLSPTGHELVLNTAGLALTVAGLGTLLGLTSALALVMLPFPGKVWLHRGLVLPALLGPFIVPVLLIVFVGRSGILFSTYFGLGFDLYGFGGIALCQVIAFTPTAHLVILAALRALNPKLLWGTASLGVSHFQILWRVVFPGIRHSIGQAFLILLVESAADLATPLVLGGKYRVLTIAMYDSAISTNALRSAGSYALVLALVSLLVILVTKSFTPPVVTLQSSEWNTEQGWESQSVPPRPLSWLLKVLTWLQSAIGWGLTFGLLGIALGTVWGWGLGGVPDGISPEAALLSPVANSTFLALIAVPLTVFVALGLALNQPRRQGAKLLFALMRIFLQLPSSVFALGLLCAFAQPWRWQGQQIFPALVGGTSWGQGAIVIIAAYTLRCLNLALSIIEIDLRRIDPLWWEVSSSLGVGNRRQQDEILFPSLKIALITAISISFATTMSSLSTVAFLPTSSWKGLTMSMLAQMDGANYQLLSVSGLILFSITAGVHLASTRLRSKDLHIKFRR